MPKSRMRLVRLLRQLSIPFLLLTCSSLISTFIYIILNVNFNRAQEWGWVSSSRILTGPTLAQSQPIATSMYSTPAFSLDHSKTKPTEPPNDATANRTESLGVKSAQSKYVSVAAKISPSYSFMDEGAKSSLLHSGIHSSPDRSEAVKTEALPSIDILRYNVRLTFIFAPPYFPTNDPCGCPAEQHTRFRMEKEAGFHHLRIAIDACALPNEA
ncbi:hypothetical protein K438DRAFT_1762365 [Mycena galopus ATCC 62051]|nr:hypothetical protein K438DRAFT_1762365 [Mycena galopus ATCC 62051]